MPVWSRDMHGSRRVTGRVSLFPGRYTTVIDCLEKRTHELWFGRQYVEAIEQVVAKRWDGLQAMLYAYLLTKPRAMNVQNVLDVRSKGLWLVLRTRCCAVSQRRTISITTFDTLGWRGENIPFPLPLPHLALAWRVFPMFFFSRSLFLTFMCSTCTTSSTSRAQLEQSVLQLHRAVLSSHTLKIKFSRPFRLVRRPVPQRTRYLS